MKNTQETKQKILDALEGKKRMQVKLKFTSRWDLFVIGWKHTRKFPNYSLKEELRKLFFPEKLECLVK